MYSHYVPRYYLLGFADPKSNLLWRFDTQIRSSLHTSVKNVGGENNFYSENVERYLAEKIESPAVKIYAKIKDHEILSQDEKYIFSNYLAVMIKRVPTNLELMKIKSPEIIDNVLNPIDDRIDKLIESGSEKVNILIKRKAELLAIKEKYQNGLPKEIWEAILPPEKSPRIVDALAKMTWIFYSWDREPGLITSDNPVFFFTSMGIGNKYSEVSFPLTTRVVLWCSWRQDLVEGYYKGSSQLYKEFNRRTIKNKLRYVFSDNNYYWIPILIDKTNLRLTMIR